MTIPTIYSTKILTDIWGNASDFVTDFKACPFYVATTYTDDNLNELYYLLYARYGNAAIAGFDENQWKYRMYTTIHSYMPTYLQKAKIQADLRALGLDVIKDGGQTINNHAVSPTDPISTDSDTILTYINDQVVGNVRLSDLEGYVKKYNVLDDTIIDEFLNKFRDLFIKITYPQFPLLYEEQD